MLMTYLIAIVFSAVLAAGWNRWFPSAPRPGTRAWDRSVSVFAIVVLLTAMAHLRGGRTPEAAATVFLGVVAVGVATYAGWRYRSLAVGERQG